MLRQGFTVVEIIITITIMGILLALAVVNLNNSQISGRDDERKADVKSITDALESFYIAGSDTSTVLRQYPETTAINTEAKIRSVLRDVNMDSFTAPGATTVAATFTMATNAVQTESGIAPQPTINQYVYQPLSSTNALCTAVATECRKYNIFYRLEGDNSVYKMMSKNQ